jgi:hypothetical protein
MDGTMDKPYESCGCHPYVSSGDNPTCAPCSPNMILTCQEESILGKLREIKETARGIEERLQKLGSVSAEFPSGEAERHESELMRLSGELDELRNQWHGWTKKLDEAIERKWILLGHREAPPGSSIDRPVHDHL